MQCGRRRYPVRLASPNEARTRESVACLLQRILPTAPRITPKWRAKREAILNFREAGGAKDFRG